MLAQIMALGQPTPGDQNLCLLPPRPGGNVASGGAEATPDPPKKSSHWLCLDPTAMRGAESLLFVGSVSTALGIFLYLNTQRPQPLAWWLAQSPQ